MYYEFTSSSQIECDSQEEAIGLVKEGTAWSAVVIDSEFTIALFLRLCPLYPEDDEDVCDLVKGRFLGEIVNASTVHLYSDLSSEQDITNNSKFSSLSL